MPSRSTPAIAQDTYNETIYGYYGTLGKSHYGVRFIQTALAVTEIEKLTLVSEIPDSEKWPVRELFQRDIDSERVEDEIIPYLKKATKIKFFNPLTIVLLPSDQHQHVLRGVQETQSKNTEYLPNEESLVLEAHGYYKIQVPEQTPQWSSVTWNSRKVRLVAVDGQHRLSALKRLYAQQQRDLADPELVNVEFSSWKIPIVLIIFPPFTTTPDYLLSSLRDIFVTINTEAKSPNRCRTVLLNDNSLSSICCQELLDFTHNDSSAKIPLLFFDWRAHDDSRNNQYPQHSAPFMRVEELHDLQSTFLLGSDSDRQDQHRALSVREMDEPLSEDEFEKNSQLRGRYREILMPAVIHLLSNFAPLVPYVKFLKELPAECDTLIQKHALSLLEYGSDYGTQDQRIQIQKEHENLSAGCTSQKKKIPLLFFNLIGLRGIFSGLNGFIQSHDDSAQTIIPHLQAAKTYIAHINKAYQNKLLKEDCPHLIWVCIDGTTDKFINYRLEDQEKALGAYCALLACTYESREKFSTSIDKLLGFLEDTIQRGYRKQVSKRTKEQNPTLNQKELKDLISKNAEGLIKKHMKKLREELKINA